MLAIVVNTVFLAGGVLVILMAMYQRQRTREMEHRERLAMIEKGMVPGPERDPRGFEAWQQQNQPPTLATSIGVVIVALGLALMLFLSVAAATPEIGVGLGGAIVVLGVAFIVNGQLRRRSQPPPYWRPPQPPGAMGS